MSRHPYRDLPRTAFWRQSVAEADYGSVDPVADAKFVLQPTDRVATAGSCFAQHIARHLERSGFNYLVTETAHPLIPEPLAREYGYGVFTARYANIYTSRQMLQLLLRAYGLFSPSEDIWLGDDGSFLDPFRPQIQPRGFASRDEFYADRERHFACVRAAIDTLDCLIFTLGLTECWHSAVDGAAFPLCPGVSGGAFDGARHRFHNLTFQEISADLDEIVRFVAERNPAARLIITVSPVPLIATATQDHVLSATTFSKSVLRAVAGELAQRYPHVAYFPSYEIITGAYSRGRYFGSDLRSVTEEGVSHVMRLFLRHYGGVSPAETTTGPIPEPAARSAAAAHTEMLAEAVCEEEALQMS